MSYVFRTAADNRYRMAPEPTRGADVADGYGFQPPLP
jgi:hypothetical protein